MKKYLIACIMLLTLLGCQPTPDVVDSENQPISFKTYRGQWVVIQYWADWCSTCVEEITELNQLALTSVKVFGINVDNKTAAELNELKKSLVINYPLLQSDVREIFNWEAVSGVPVIYAIDPKGNAHGPLLGKQTKESIEAWITDQQT
jgi:thiol-disulfide isomerase/thioredoxin